MNIWVISSSYPRTPAESINAGVVARDLALEIAELGHDVTVITPDKPEGVVFDPSLNGVVIPWWKPSVQISDISKRPSDLLRAASLLVNARNTIRNATRHERPDGIVALWALPSGLFARWAAEQAGCPYVIWILGSDVWRARDIPRGIATLREVLEESRSVFADGTQLAQEATRLTGVKVSFLPSARRLPKPSGIPVELIDVLFVGRYHTNKGPDILLESLRLLKTGKRHVQAQFFGDGDLADALRRTVNAYGLSPTVTINGPIGAQDLANRLAATRLLVIPSRIESIPLILGDSVQARTPMVASRVGDMGSLVEELGIGVTALPGDPDDLARVIADALADGIKVPDWSKADDLLSPGAASSIFLSALGFDSTEPGTY